MNPFDDYGRRATTTAAPRLVGAIKTRTAAKARYVEIVAELEACCDDPDALVCFIASLSPEIAQFKAELDFLWEGDGDFPGLQREIARARERACSDECRPLSDRF